MANALDAVAEIAQRAALDVGPASVVIDDSRTYGTIGVVFTLLTWFILIGGVIVLGAALGAVWQQERGNDARASA